MKIRRKGSLFCTVCAYVPQPDDKRCKLCGRTAQRCDMCGRDCRNPMETEAAVFCQECVEKGPAEAGPVSETETRRG